MDTRRIATEYRLAHWAQIIRERHESGLSIRAYCERAGLHENTYYYWQRKLRETACEQIAEIKGATVLSHPTHHGFTEVEMVERTERLSLGKAVGQGVLHIEVSGISITADHRYPAANLGELLKALALS